ncbi:MAG TPA: glycerophosphodiester phosphodiesterase family protein [Phycisphaerae bacterium]|nr:glycerophosphodiester phosphodiesterase family protein [Phycisphaerae bacterium]HPU27133.1 glycerophosphodiester phosphodiesterase family protein [Phycisphaerae bacterium]
MRRFMTVLSAASVLVISAAVVHAEPDAPAADAPLVLGYINSIPPESPEAREARHKLIAQRRSQDHIIIVHRGANRVKPENTLEAYSAAMDLGADGVEFDPRKSKDGVLYIMHDDRLDRTTRTGKGRGRDHTYYEILQAGIKGGDKNTRVPTVAAFLTLARERGMLLHLDVKEPGLQEELERLLDEADMWDHVVEVNASNAERLRSHPKVKLIPFKWGDVPNDDKSEAARAGIQAWINRKEGKLGMVDDPRAVCKALGREPQEFKPIPKYLRAYWSPSGIVSKPAQPGPTTIPADQ